MVSFSQKTEELNFPETQANRTPITPQNISKDNLSRIIAQNSGLEFAFSLLTDENHRHLTGAISYMKQALLDELNTIEPTDRSSLTHIAYGYTAHQKISNLLFAFAQGDKDWLHKIIAQDQEKVDSLFFHPDEIPKLNEELAKHDNLPMTNAIFQAEQIARGLLCQWRSGVTDAKSMEFVKSLYQRLKRFNSHKEMATNYTSHEKVRLKLEDTLTSLIEKGIIDPAAPILLLGPATGLDVEGPVLSELMDNKILKRCKVVGVDQEAQSQHWAGMKMFQMSFTEYVNLAKNNPDSTKFGTVIAIGSVWNNVESLHEWFTLMQSLEKITKANAVMLYETGDIDTGNAQTNYRIALANDMVRERPDMLFGMYGIIDAYRDSNDPANAYGATLFTRSIYNLLFRMANFTKFIEANSYEASNNTDHRMIYVTQKGSSDQLAQSLFTVFEFLSRSFALPQ